MAAGLLVEGPGGQRVGFQRSITSTIAPQTSVRSFSSQPTTKGRKGRATDASAHEVVLKSTNYSLTSLGFRHGNIRVKQRARSVTKSGTSFTARSSLTISHTTITLEESKAAPIEDEDEPVYDELDLSGFQIAILGSIGLSLDERTRLFH
jgi:hypothetical protein